MVKKIRKRSLVAASALFLVAGPLTGTAVGQDSELDLRDAGQPARVQAASTAADLDALTLPIVSEQMARLASNLMETFGEDPNFASAEVTRDRSSLIVHWHGSPSSEVLAAVGSEPTVDTVFQATRFSPGALRSAAQALLSNDRSVKGVEVAHDGSGLRALVEQAQSGRTLSRSAAASRLSTAAGFPVSVDYTPVVPASTRQNDVNYHLGGARVYRFDGAFITGGCTTGFSVVKQGDTSQQGMMFAAHCGSVGDQFITSDGTFAYTYGNITVRDTTNDGAIIGSGWSQPFIWTSTWDSSVYTRINGVASPYVGQELCYSGSYSGLVCGNIVSATGFNYSLGGDLTAVQGFITENSAGNPAAGNGDSGGPGYQLVNTPNGYKRWAVGIISAIPADSPQVCAGVAGSATRKCSPTVVSTSVVQIGASTGWYVPTS